MAQLVDTNNKISCPATSSRSPSYLYRKRNIYYYRFAIPRHMQAVLGGAEIRLSLRTAYLREAKPLADKLHEKTLGELRKKEMLTLAEVRQRL